MIGVSDIAADLEDAPVEEEAKVAKKPKKSKAKQPSKSKVSETLIEEAKGEELDAPSEVQIDTTAP